MLLSGVYLYHHEQFRRRTSFDGEHLSGESGRFVRAVCIYVYRPIYSCESVYPVHWMLRVSIGWFLVQDLRTGVPQEKQEKKRREREEEEEGFLKNQGTGFTSSVS